jgi:hypothetical protein
MQNEEYEPDRRTEDDPERGIDLVKDVALALALSEQQAVELLERAAQTPIGRTPYYIALGLYFEFEAVKEQVIAAHAFEQMRRRWRAGEDDR